MIALAGHGKDSRLVQLPVLPIIEGDENYTPNYFFVPCKNFLKSFDLDPFSCELANQTIAAETFWDKEDNALIQDWTSFKRKWVNPPYSSGLIGKAIAKTLEYSHIGETLLLVNTSSSAKWFQACMEKCAAYLHPSKRINFNSPFRTSKGNRYDQTLFYFGDRPLEFAEALSSLGNAVQPIRKKICLPISTVSAELEPLAKLADAQEKLAPSRTSTSTKRRNKSIATTSQSLASIPTSETITHPRESISTQEDSPVLEPQSLENATGLNTQNLISGTNTSELSTKESPTLSPSKILQDCLMENSISEWVKSSKTFPKSGIWENGKFSQQGTLDRPKLEKGCLSLPTLTTGLGAKRNAGATSCETWLKDKGFVQPTQALSIEMMCLLFGFPIAWAKSLSNAPKDRLDEQQPESSLVEQSISTVQSSQLSESSICIEFSVNNIDARLQFLLEQRDRLIASGASPQGVWLSVGQVYKKDFRQVVWKSAHEHKWLGGNKSRYIGKENSDEHISAIAQHKAGQELRKIEREIKKLQVKS